MSRRTSAAILVASTMLGACRLVLGLDDVQAYASAGDAAEADAAPASAGRDGDAADEASTASAPLLDPTVCIEEFCWLNPAPQGRDLRAIHANSATDVLAGGDDVLLHFDGNVWRDVPFARSDGGTMAWRSLTGNGRDAYWGAYGNAVYRIDLDADGGAPMLRPVPTPTCGQCNQPPAFVVHDGAGALYVGFGTQLAILNLLSGTWIYTVSPRTGASFVDAWAATPDDIWFTTSNGLVRYKPSNLPANPAMSVVQSPSGSVNSAWTAISGRVRDDGTPDAYALDGTTIYRFGSFGSPVGTTTSGNDLAVDADGRVYLAEGAFDVAELPPGSLGFTRGLQADAGADLIDPFYALAVAGGDVWAVGARGLLWRRQADGWRPRSRHVRIRSSPLGTHSRHGIVEIPATGEVLVSGGPDTYPSDGVVARFDGSRVGTEIVAPQSAVGDLALVDGQIWAATSRGVFARGGPTSWAFASSPSYIADAVGIATHGQDVALLRATGQIYRRHNGSWSGIPAIPYPNDCTDCTSNSLSRLWWNGGATYYAGGSTYDSSGEGGELERFVRYDGTGWKDQEGVGGISGLIGGLWAPPDAVDSEYWVANSSNLTHFDGAGYAKALGIAFAGVTGTAKDDIWAVETNGGGAWHYDGAAWSRRRVGPMLLDNVYIGPTSVTITGNNDVVLRRPR